jgi:hypothetical protein
MTARNSEKARRICVDTHAWVNLLGRLCMTCHVCGTTIDLVHKKPKWRADHIKRHAEGGKETPDNLWPICIDCDAGEGGKAADDTKTVAHGKRMSDRHLGIKQSRGWGRR